MLPREKAVPVARALSTTSSDWNVVTSPLDGGLTTRFVL